MRNQISKLFQDYRDGAATDVGVAAQAFDAADPKGLTDNQKNHYNAMESLLQGQASHWPASSPSLEGSKTTRVSVRLMIYAARNSNQVNIVFNAGRVLAQAAVRKEVCIPLRFSHWDWQYLGNAPVPGTKWGYTTQSHPIDRIKKQQPWIQTIYALLPVKGREMDKEVKTDLDFARAPGGYPEIYAVAPEKLVEMYIRYRR